MPRRRPALAAFAVLVVLPFAAPVWAATATRIGAGDSHTCARTDSGGLRCWGDVAIGDGDVAKRRIPVDVPSLAGIVADIAIGREHNCVVTTTGGAKCWGRNANGEVGTGTTSPNELVPVDVVGLSSGVLQIAAGWHHTCAVLSGGGVKCWGKNHAGQLGDGTTDDSALPVDVVGLGAPVTALAASFARTCALTDAGGVKCWGDLTTGASLAPLDVVGLTSGVTAIVDAEDHTCALLASGGVKCWGQNDFGQLGRAISAPSATPVDVYELTDAVAINAIASHTCVVTSSGGAKCWGRNVDGQIGDDTSVPYRISPYDVSELSSGVAAVAAGVDHSCAVKTDGSVKCWGAGFHGAIGSGDLSPLQPLPASVVDFGPPVCALLDAGQIFASAPSPRLVVSQARPQWDFDDKLTIDVTFALPPGVAVTDLAPQEQGVRLQIRDGSGAVHVDARLRGGWPSSAPRARWTEGAHGRGWTYRVRSGEPAPFGVQRFEIIDRSEGAPGGKVRVTVRAKKGYFPFGPLDGPLELTLILGDDAAAPLGLCGKSDYAPADCSVNQTGGLLKCNKSP
ncbi:hypothetical protein K2Z84_24520 [Candidatus Binatia bacterium]|nr:hypothetical protein [Candidatus Binatia bacterium]